MLKGIDYFPLDCHLNEEYQYIEAEYGIKGFAVIIKLLQRIYSGHGYYCDFNERVAAMFAHSIGESSDTVNKVVMSAIDEGIFSKEMYHAHGILTSADIQRKFSHITRKRKNPFHTPQYILPEIIKENGNGGNSDENVGSLNENVSKKEQSKVKQSKAKKRKGMYSKAEQSKEATPCADACACKTNYFSDFSDNEKQEDSADKKREADTTSPDSDYSDNDSNKPSTRQELAALYGEDNVAHYETRFRTWSAGKRHPGDMYKSISAWMKQDNVKPPTPEEDELTDRILDQYPGYLS